MLVLSSVKFILALSVLLESVQSQEEEAWTVTGVIGRRTDLPCYLTPRITGDKPKLILWYKEPFRNPIFSQDTRVPQKHTDMRGEDAWVSVQGGTATLTYQSITPSHGGLYECRVEFYKSPAHTNFVNLSIVELPKSVQILDREDPLGQPGVLGPYRPGDTLSLTCISLDGFPLPNLTWWKDSSIMSSVWEVTGPGQVQSDLVIEDVTRHWHNQTITCTASNTHLVNPVTATALIQMYTLPTSVLIDNPKPAREGHQVRLVCRADGSRPPATLTWKLRDRSQRPNKESETRGTMTLSTLVLNVTRSDNEAIVTCIAKNPQVPGTVLSNTTLLTVHYPPTLSAFLGRSLNPDMLKEGDDVYFTCIVDANPPASPITWYHEGNIQVQNMSGGVILSGASLVLQQVRRRQAGEYRCAAANSLASVTSSPVTLKIRYKPECLTLPAKYFIYDKPINITCTVRSYPPPKSIHWQWHNSNDVISVREITEASEKESTQLTVHPTESYEDRLLSCWAVNEMGRQPQPCDFSVKVAEMPLPLSSCRLANITASSLSLTCKRPSLATAALTLYRAEVYFDNLTLFANVTSHRPQFNVSRLDAGTSYQIKVYVSQGHVTSPPILVSAYTSRTSRKNSDKAQNGDGGGGTAERGDDEHRDGKEGGIVEGVVSGGGSMGAVVGGVVATILVIVGVVWAHSYYRAKWAARRKDVRLASAEEANNPDVVPNVGTSFSGRRNSSLQRFWYKEESFDQLQLEETSTGKESGAGYSQSSTVAAQSSSTTGQSSAIADQNSSLANQSFSVTEHSIIGGQNPTMAGLNSTIGAQSSPEGSSGLSYTAYNDVADRSSSPRDHEGGVVVVRDGGGSSRAPTSSVVTTANRGVVTVHEYGVVQTCGRGSRGRPSSRLVGEDVVQTYRQSLILQHLSDEELSPRESRPEQRQEARTLPRVIRQQHTTYKRRNDSVGGRRVQLYYPVDQLIKSAESIV